MPRTAHEPALANELGEPPETRLDRERARAPRMDPRPAVFSAVADRGPWGWSPYAITIHSSGPPNSTFTLTSFKAHWSTLSPGVMDEMIAKKLVLPEVNQTDSEHDQARFTTPCLPERGESTGAFADRAIGAPAQPRPRANCCSSVLAAAS